MILISLNVFATDFHYKMVAIAVVEITKTLNYHHFLLFMFVLNSEDREQAFWSERFSLCLHHFLLKLVVDIKNWQQE